MRRGASSPLHGFIEGAPDPNNDIDKDAIRYWLKYADFYQWPHVVYYSSVDDLVQKLATTDLQAVSERMKEHNAKVAFEVKQTWSKIMLKVIR